MKHSSALERLKEARRQRATLEQPARHHAAAASDADNEAYMQEFEAAFQQLSHSSPHLSLGQLQPPAQQHSPSSPAKPARHPSARRPAPLVAAPGISRDHQTAAASWRTGPVDAAGGSHVATQQSWSPAHVRNVNSNRPAAQQACWCACQSGP